jgi:transcriptional regulator with XRE-family HTH domain
MKRNTEDKPYRLIGKNLKRIRIYAGLSQAEFGKILGVTFQQVQKYEIGINRLPAYQLFMLHRTFNVPLEFFFEGIDTPDEDDCTTPLEALSRRIGTIRDNKTALKMLKLMDVVLDLPQTL